MKTYLKPKSISIEIDVNEIMAGSGEEVGIGGSGTESDAKRMTHRIFDDSDDWSNEDY